MEEVDVKQMHELVLVVAKAVVPNGLDSWRCQPMLRRLLLQLVVSNGIVA